MRSTCSRPTNTAYTHVIRPYRSVKFKLENVRAASFGGTRTDRTADPDGGGASDSDAEGGLSMAFGGGGTGGSKLRKE